MNRRDWPGLRRVFRLPFSRRQLRADVDAELTFHIQGRVDELIAHGMPREEAESEARRRFGNYGRVETELERLDRHAQTRRSMADRLGALWADLRYTARSLIAQPVFTAVVVLTLTLGITATAALFHALDRVVLHPLPYPDAERIVYLGWSWNKGGYADALSPPKFEFWHDQSRVFSGLAASRSFDATLGEEGSDAIAHGLRITGDFLHVLGIAPSLGRGFTAGEFALGGPPVAILSHAVFATRFGGDRGAIGRHVRLDGHPYTIVGVMPESFEVAGTSGPDVLVPLAFTPEQRAGDGNNYNVIGRLRPGVSPPQITDDMARVFAQYRVAFAGSIDPADRGVIAMDYQRLFVGDLSSVLWIMFGATAFVLVLACANVANLLLARALSRQREFAVRTALGAGRGRLARQVILEVVLIGIVSAVLSTGTSLMSVRGIVALANQELLRESQLSLDPRVLAYTILVALAVSIIIGVAVALSATRVELPRSLSEGGRSATTGMRQRWVRGVLVSTESAIAMLLLAGAGLLLASFAKVSSVNPGFDRDGVFTATITQPSTGYEATDAVWRFEQDVLTRLRSTPGITSAGGASSLPLVRGWNLPMTLEGRPDATEGGAEWRAVSPSYFSTFGIRLIAGRDIRESDNASSPRVVIVSEGFAKRYYPGESPIGHRILLGRFKGKLIGPAFDEPPREIVGVVADLRDKALDQQRLVRTVWVPQAQVVTPLLHVPAFAVRATDPSVAATALRHAIRAADPRMSGVEVSAMSEIVSTSLSWRRFSVVLMSVFALLALALTCVGIYGVVAYSAAQRVHEMGVRIALGARPSSVVALVVRQGMRPAAIGLVVGAAGALGLSRLLAGMLYGVSPHDPLPLAAVAALLAGVAFLASYIPARRASRVDPLTALRGE